MEAGICQNQRRNLLLIWVMFVASTVLGATVHYVDINSPNPLPPFADWSTAATNIQDAIRVAATNDVVLVTNGVYPGGVAVTNPLTLRSVNGPQFTVINGGGTNRCVSLSDSSNLTGFTLTNGYALNGGGVQCATANVFLTNCVIAGCSSLPEQYNSGGGAYGGTLYNCTLTGNSAMAVTVFSYGGGACGSTLYNCALISNSASFGGGACSSTLYNCTLAGNTAVPTLSEGALGGGAAFSTLYNCIIYFNMGVEGPNCDPYYCTLTNCCTTPLPSPSLAYGIITNNPLFVNYTNGNLRLQSNSPCINSGKNSYAAAGPDLDGNPRIVGGTVDRGAYEFQFPQSIISYAWLQQYGFPNDGSVDTADPDGDHMSNYQEWIAGTNPTNSLSALLMLAPSNTTSGISVPWQSVSGINYFLQRSTNLGVQPAFTTIQSNLVGQADVSSFTDTNAVGAGPFFYRVGVQQ